jgi:hypothetical protein
MNFQRPTAIIDGKKLIYVDFSLTFHRYYSEPRVRRLYHQTAIGAEFPTVLPFQGDARLCRCLYQSTGGLGDLGVHGLSQSVINKDGAVYYQEG